MMLLATIPAFIMTHALLVHGQMRITDPMIGAPQFSKPGGTIPGIVDKCGIVDTGSWLAWLQPIDFM